MPKSPLDPKNFISPLSEIPLDSLEGQGLLTTKKEKRLYELEQAILQKKTQSVSFSDEKQVDSKGNLISVCLFESYLSKCALDNQGIFKESFLAMVTGLELFFKSPSPALDQIIQSKPPRFDLNRELYSIFTCLNTEYPRYDSFESFKELPFNLSACCYLVKLIADKILKPDYSSPSSQGMFAGSPDKRSPYSPWRPALLFSEANRGVIDIGKGRALPTKSIGIVEEPFQPRDLKNYFTNKKYPSMAIYRPNEDSFVGQWLRKRNLPIISGSSGSTELLFSRIFKVINLNLEYINMINIGQTFDMIAQGHHSFFEAILVAEFFNLGHFPTKPINLLSFYLHWIPLSILEAPWFEEFILNNPNVQPLAHYDMAAAELSPLEQNTPCEGSMPRERGYDALLRIGSIDSFRRQP